MKRTISIIAIVISCSTLNSCTQYIPAEDNNFVMMRANDIQFQDEVANRQKYTTESTHTFDLKRFFQDLFSPQPIITSPLDAVQTK